MSAVAYVVGVIDRATRELVGVSVFSEPTPTVSFKLCPVVLFTARALKYQYAEQDAIHELHTNPQHQWLLPVLDKATPALQPREPTPEPEKEAQEELPAFMFDVDDGDVS